MDLVLNTTGSGVSGGPKMLFREDGLRQPPLFTASNNLIIMIIGLSILIVPVVCFVICMCLRINIFESIRNLKFSNRYTEGTKLPYSHFDSDNTDSGNNIKIPVPKDVRVLIHSDNTAPGSPKFSNTGENICNIMKKSTALRPSRSSSSLEFSNVDLDPTFVLAGDNSFQREDNHS